MSDPWPLPGDEEVVDGRHEDDLDAGLRLADLTASEAIALLSGGHYGRLVFTYRALPEIIPVNYRVVDHAVVVRVSGTSRAAEGALDTVVAFQVDEIDTEARTGWSVTVLGRSHEILDPVQRQQVLDPPLAAWAGGRRDRLIRIPMDRLTGRRLLPRTGEPAA